MNKKYLGDSVYVETDSNGDTVLTTENGLGPTNTVILEPEVMMKLIDWIHANITNLHEV